MITKADKAIIYALAVVALIALLATLVYAKTLNSSSSEVVICSEGREVARYPLNGEARRVDISGPLGKSVVEISSDKARMFDSPCPRKICCAQGWIASPDRAIICIPNRVVIKIESTNTKTSLDAVNR